MSLKDDFLEALNSVKKDIFNGTEDTDLDTEQSPISAKDSSLEYARPVTPEDEIPPPPMDDQAVFGAFKQASEINDDAEFGDDGELHNDEPLLSASIPATFKSYDPDRSYIPETDDEALASGPPAVNGFSSFDRTDLYTDDKTVISKNTIIRGSLQTDDSVRLLGQVHGDIDCKSNIVIAGKIRGNTSAANAYVMDAQIDGSLSCDDVVSVNSDAWVLGDIRAQQAEIDGKIKGNLDIRHAVSIGTTSSIIGNISTDELEIKRGAFINGQIMMYTPSRDVLDRFDHFEN